MTDAALFNAKPETRNSKLVLLLALLMLAAGCSTTKPGYRLAGYHPYWMGDAYTQYDLRAFDEVLFFEITVQADGSFGNTHGWPDRWQPLVKAARRTPVVPTFTLFDADAFRALFSDPAAQGRLLENIVALVDEARADGAHLDFEIFAKQPPEVRDRFTAWVRLLRTALGDDALLTTYALAYDENDVFDEAGLAPYVDYFFVQGYDLHWRGDEIAGPVAGLAGWGRLNWQFILDRYLAEGVPADKLIFTVPLYGYEWPTESGEMGSRTRGRARTITYAPNADARLSEIDGNAVTRAAQHGLQRDPISGSPYYAYQDSTGWRQGWFEDATSLRAKCEFAVSNGLAGLALFPLGYDDNRLTPALRQCLDRPRSE